MKKCLLLKLLLWRHVANQGAARGVLLPLLLWYHVDRNTRNNIWRTLLLQWHAGLSTSNAMYPPLLWWCGRAGWGMWPPGLWFGISMSFREMMLQRLCRRRLKLVLLFISMERSTLRYKTILIGVPISNQVSWSWLSYSRLWKWCPQSKQVRWALPTGCIERLWEWKSSRGIVGPWGDAWSHREVVVCIVASSDR